MTTQSSSDEDDQELKNLPPVTWSKITNSSQIDYMTIIVIMIGWSTYWQWKGVISQFGNSMKEKKFHSYSANSPRLTNSILECQTTWKFAFSEKQNSSIQKHTNFCSSNNVFLQFLHFTKSVGKKTLTNVQCIMI